MAGPSSGRRVFDAVVIDLEGRRLLRAGVEQPLEPKAFSVLALLAEAPGRVFTRDEILDAVWGHRHVTPGVLNRVVTLVRQALGEDAQHPRLLHTVHGVGYRLDLPETSQADSRADASPGASTGAAEDATAAPGATPPRRGRTVAFVAAVLAIAVLAWVSWLRTGGPPSADEDLPAPTLVVMPLKPIGEEASTRLVADGLGEELICSLARIDGLRVIAHTSSVLVAADPGDPAERAQRLGATHALEGNLQQAGQALRVRMRLVETASGRTVWVKDFDREASEVLGLQRDVAEEVATSLALKMGLPAAPVVTSGDAGFLARYMAARALLERADLPREQSVDMAEAEFRALIDERGDDARAHAGLALTLAIAAMREPARAGSLRDEAVREALAARSLDPGQAESYSVEAYFACLEDDWARCLALKSQAFRLSPSNTYVAQAYVNSLIDLGYLERAEAIARELSARDPLSGQAHLVLGRLLDARGHHEAAQVELQQAGPSGLLPLWLNAVRRRDYTGALQLVEDRMAREGNAGSGALAPGLLAATQALVEPGRWPHARRAFDQFAREHGRWHFADVLSPDIHLRSAETIAQLDSARRNGQVFMGLLLWAGDTVALRRQPAFQDYLRNSGILDYWRAQGFPSQCRRSAEGVHCD